MLCLDFFTIITTVNRTEKTKRISGCNHKKEGLWKKGRKMKVSDAPLTGCFVHHSGYYKRDVTVSRICVHCRFGMPGTLFGYR
jgi:hypothetical protein